MTEDTKFYVDVLTGEECQCGNYKKRKMALCYNCWQKLPEHMQKDVYKRIHSGFEEAYDEAVEWLND